MHVLGLGEVTIRGLRSLSHKSDASQRVWSSASVAESSGSARQGAKTSASVNNLTPTQPHLVYNLTLIILCLGLITAIHFDYNINRAV